MLADKALRGMGFFRTVFASTVATSVAVASLMFLVLFNPSIGVLTKLLPFEVLKNPACSRTPTRRCSPWPSPRSGRTWASPSS